MATHPTLPPSPPAPGVWCPAVTFFNPETDTLDLVSQKTYYSYLSRTGLAGLVILGTNAEAFLMTREERAAVIAVAREAVGPSYPLMAGCGAYSTKATLELVADAHRAGADYALVLPASYFGKATTSQVIESFYAEVAAKSALPIVIYNFPGVCNGVDLDSELIAKLALEHTNIVGVKLTCASVGKMTRLAATLPKARFSIFGGQSDFLIGGLSVGSAGCITAFANIFPKFTSRIYTLYSQGRVEEAVALQYKAALAESPCKSGIASTKYAVAAFTARAVGISDAENKLQPRRPYAPPGEALKQAVRNAMTDLFRTEQELPMVS